MLGVVSMVNQASANLIAALVAEGLTVRAIRNRVKELQDVPEVELVNEVLKHLKRKGDK